ncbi:TRAP transporter small permease [Geminicoccaceae bacterium 1502E]|nr:TRAP transporter small permease [Geminicoccaceae bacterium 1502E]
MISAVSLWMSRAGGAMLLLAAVLISFEILTRKLLHLPFNVGTELSTYALAVGATWSFAYALLQRAHVRIDVLQKLLPPAVRSALDLAAMLSLATVALVLAWHIAGTLATSISLGARENTPLATPLALPQGLWLVGMIWFALVAVEQSVRVLLAFAAGDHAGVARLSAAAGVEEELDEALDDVARRLGRTG